MNILSDIDLINYLTKEQVFVTKDIVNIDFKPEFEKGKVYKIDTVDINHFGESTEVNNIKIKSTDKSKDVILYSNGIRLSTFKLNCSSFEMYAKFKHLFIPISELYEAYKNC